MKSITNHRFHAMMFSVEVLAGQCDTDPIFADLDFVHASTLKTPVGIGSSRPRDQGKLLY